MRRINTRKPTILAVAFAMATGLSTGVAIADGGDTLGEVKVESQEQLVDLNIQIDMSSVENDTEVTVDNEGTIVASQDGQEMTVLQDGSWTIKNIANPGEISQRADWGACAGSFVNVYVNVEDDLQWGGQQVCESTSQRPHKLDVTLRQGPDRPLARQTNKITSKGKYSSGRTANNYVYSPCLNHVTHRSSMVVTPYAGGVQWPKVVSKDTVVKCNTR